MTPAENSETDATPSAGLALGIFAIYFGLHFVTRSLVSGNLQLDEAEQFIVTQDWRWGYGSQPPLYNWMQKALFSIFGANVPALSILKNFTLWSAYAFTYFAAREILGSLKLAALAACALLFIPQLAWESQRDQSHLVMATACSAATLFAFVRVLKTQRLGSYALFGMAAAFGFLSKYNYAILPAALILAALTLKEFRAAILTPKILITALVFAALAGPHLYWMLQNKTEVASQSYKFGMAASSPVSGVWRLIKASISIAIVPTLIFSPFLYARFKSGPGDLSPNPLLLKRTFVAGLLLCLAGVLIFRVTYIRDRWMQPLFFAWPIFLSALVGSVKARHFKRLTLLAAAVGVTVLIAINITVLGANAMKRAHNLNIPYPSLAAELRKSGFQNGTIIANGFLLGGNLKKQFKESRVITPELDDKPRATGSKLIIWNARENELPEDFRDYVTRKIHLSQPEIRPLFLEIPCRNGKRKSERFGYFLTN